MLNNLNKTIENNNFKNFTNIEIMYNELIISAKTFTGYEMLLELDTIRKMIDTKIYRVQYLNDNIIAVRTKK